MEIELDFPNESLIGTEMTVTVQEKVGSFRGLNKYKCTPAESLPSKWYTVITIPEERTISKEESIEGWIFDIDKNNKEIRYTTDSFGRADLHTLRDAHINAADYVAYLVLTNVSDSSEVELDQVSHAKGLLSRCIRKDQWDWYTVYRLLGKPPSRKLHQGQQALSQLRNEAKKGNDGRVKQCVEKLRECEMAKRFAYFVRRVNLGDEYSSIDEEYLLQKLHRLDPTVFEHFVSDLWSQLGWETQVIPVDEDRGADIIATQKEVFTRKLAIQVKRLDPSSKHGLKEVQRYMALSMRNDVDGALLITTGKFTQNARKEASASSYELMDGSELSSFIRKNDFQHIVDNYVDTD